MKELSFDQMENLEGSRACAYVALGTLLIVAGAFTGGALSGVGAVVGINNAQACGGELDEAFGCLGTCSGGSGGQYIPRDELAKQRIIKGAPL